MSWDSKELLRPIRPRIESEEMYGLIKCSVQEMKVCLQNAFTTCGKKKTANRGKPLLQYAAQVDKQNTLQYRLFSKSLKEVTLNVLSKGN